MPLNTVKAIKERKAKAEKELRSLNDAIEAAEGDKRAEAVTAFDAAAGKLESLNGDLARAERIEGLSPEQRDNTGDPEIGDQLGEHRDSPVANPDAHGYSLLRAIQRQADGQPLNGVEGEVHQELTKRAREAGKTTKGLMVPHTMQMDARSIAAGRESRAADLQETGDSAGAIPTIQANTFIDVLRKRTVLRQLGALILSNMVGAFSIPKKTATNTFEWVAEGTAPSGGKATVGNVSFAEKTIAGVTRLTRSFVKQASLDAEAMVRQDLVDGLAVALDYGGIAGPSGGDSCVGLLYLAGINDVAMGTNGAAPTFAKMVEMETAVATADADVDNMAYVVNAATRGAAKTTLKFAGTDSMTIWEPGNQINGYDAAVSNQLPSNLTKGTSNGVCSAALFGNFADAVFALWGGVDLLVDPYSEAAEGNVRMTIHQSADFNVRRTESFARVLDVLTA